MDDSANGRYDMTLGRNIFTELGLNIILHEHVIESGDKALKGSTVTMIDLGTYKFKDLITEKNYS